MGTHQYKCYVFTFLNHVTETAEGIMIERRRRRKLGRVPHSVLRKTEANGRMWCPGDQVNQVFGKGRDNQLGQMLWRGRRR